MKRYKITTGFSPSWENNLRRALEDIRKERGEPLRDLADKINSNKSIYNRFLSGETSVTFYTLSNIFSALDIDMILIPKEDE